MSYPQQKRTRPSRRSDRAARRIRATVASALLAVSGVALGVVGVVAWISPRQEPIQLSRGVGVDLQATPMFDLGVSIFSSPAAAGGPPTAEQLGCVLSSAGVESSVSQSPADDLGTRVRLGVSLLPAVTLGPISEGDRLICSGTHLDHAAVWVLPTLPSVSPTAMSVVVAGVGCVGLSLLTNPSLLGYSRR